MPRLSHEGAGSRNVVLTRPDEADPHSDNRRVALFVSALRARARVRVNEPPHTSAQRRCSGRRLASARPLCLRWPHEHRLTLCCAFALMCVCVQFESDVLESIVGVCLAGVRGCAPFNEDCHRGRCCPTAVHRRAPSPSRGHPQDPPPPPKRPRTRRLLRAVGISGAGPGPGQQWCNAAMDHAVFLSWPAAWGAPPTQTDPVYSAAALASAQSQSANLRRGGGAST